MKSFLRKCRTLLMNASFIWGLASLSIIRPQSAAALGFNAETFSPTAGNASALLNETPHIIPFQAWMYGLTTDYVMNPVELGDGKSKRVGVVDDLLMSHFSAGYGLLREFDFYGVLPIALFDSHQNPKNYLLEFGASRKYFLLSDPRAGIKYKALEWGTRIAGTHTIAFDVRVPFGEKKAMLSDGTGRAKLSVPSSIFSTTGDWEVSLTPGIIFWGDRERVIGETGFSNGRSVFLARNWAISWDSSFQWSVMGTPRTNKHLGLEAGIRTEFSQGYISLSSAGNPWEWGLGARYVYNDKMTIHGSVGSGIGRGVGSPLARVMAGVRYTSGGYKEVESGGIFDPRDALPLYSDVELDRILADSRAEEAPRQLASDESLLRLLVGNEVVDVGYVRFKFGSSDLTPEAMKTIQLLKERLEIEKPNAIHIEGHTDSVGSLDVNMALSKRRADAVRKALIDRDIQPEIITTSGVAFRYPVASNATKQGRAANRRIEVSLNGKRFRRANPTPQELIKYREWIAPGGKRPARD
ncbi:OmpA family protein [bacterium]|nr:OmpA family protein [bacterium]